jgi:hypothetical protein
LFATAERRSTQAKPQVARLRRYGGFVCRQCGEDINDQLAASVAACRDHRLLEVLQIRVSAIAMGGRRS